MKIIIYFFSFFILFCLPTVAQTHTVKIQSPEYIQVIPAETVSEVESGSDLLLQIKFAPVCFGADLAVVVNGENVEPLKIDQENFEVNIEKITKDTEVVLSVVPVVVEGEIVYYEYDHGKGLALEVYLPDNLDTYFYSRYKKRIMVGNLNIKRFLANQSLLLIICEMIIHKVIYHFGG